MPTLAELRAHASGPRPLPRSERTVTLVEGQHLLAESQALQNELVDILAAEPGRVTEDGERVSAPRKSGQRRNPRIDEIRDAQAAMLPRLAEFQGVLTLTGMTGGAWHRWKEDHPANPESDADERLTGGLCDAGALFGELGKFVTSWNGDVLLESDWDGWLAESIIYADRRDLVTLVVHMHEDGVSRVPKSSSGSSATETSATA